MAKLAFQATVTINSAVPEGESSYRCEFNFSDRSGSHQGSDIKVNDVVFFDTTSVEPGTYTLYEITELHGVSWTGAVDLTIRYMDVNDNDFGAPPLEFIVGATGVVTRPSEQVGLMPVVSPDSQNISDTFSFYLLNHNLIQLLDNPPGTDAENLKLVTPSWLPVNPMDGRAPLPSKPVGDIVLSMGLLYLMDGSMTEVIGVEPVFEESQNQWYVQIPTEDIDELGQGSVGAIMVSYLTPK